MASSFFTVQNGSETSTECNCCKRPIHKGLGELQTNDALVAEYAYRWPEGHGGLFSLAILVYDEKEQPAPGVAAVRGTVANNGVSYSVLEPADSPWSDWGNVGPILSRERVLDSENRDHFFQVVAAIVKNDQRLSDRVKDYASGQAT